MYIYILSQRVEVLRLLNYFKCISIIKYVNLDNDFPLQHIDVNIATKISVLVAQRIVLKLMFDILS